MTFKQLPYLLAIASEGSLSKAAKKLNISQPALRSFLNQLEEQTSLPMFTIVKNQYELTEAGRLMAQSHPTLPLSPILKNKKTLKNTALGLYFLNFCYIIIYRVIGL